MSTDKIIIFQQEITSDIKGTVIDIETIGDFCDQYYDSRRCKNIQQVIFGYVNNRELVILCAKGKQAIDTLNSQTKQILEKLERPFYAFNTGFESSVWFHQLDYKILFNRELQGFPRENKGNARKSLGIPNYEDPFNDIGKHCMIAWEKGQYDTAIAHNRACLLKERDILIKRGSSNPFPLTFNK
jgi:hypothetical protein